MISDFGADGPGIESTLSVLLGHRVRTDERGRVVSMDFSDFEGSSDLHIPLTRILPQLTELTALENLDLRYCYSLTCLPSEIGCLSNLKQLTLYGCTELKTLPAAIENLKALEDLDIGNCYYSLTCLPAEIGGLSNLKQLTLTGCSVLKTLPADIGNLKALEDLDLDFCNSLTCLPAEIDGLSTNLRALDISRCSEPGLDSLSEWIGNFSSLESIHLNGYDSTRGLEMKIWSIISRLPDSVVHISLEKFYIEESKSLSSMRLPRRLRQLNLAYSPILRSTDDGQGKNHILKLLNKQNELGRVVCDDYYDEFEKSKLFSLEAQHLLDINECGRALKTEAAVALSVWPIVLARANKGLQEYPSRNANVIYSLLYGPVFASRGNFAEERKPKREQADLGADATE
jgi:Leucine-rich repeat (LRR) protein